jgi:ABC-type enterobactin transport system permease subunit
LPLSPTIGQDRVMSAWNRVHASPLQIRLGLATLVSYAIGYPVAIIAHAAVGWVFVSIGGVFLLWLIVVTVRQIDRNAREPE